MSWIESTYRVTKRNPLLVLVGVMVIGWLWSVPAWAVPANPEPVAIEQPDGIVFTAHILGDETQNWVQAESGHTLIQNMSSGYWEYAINDAYGNMVPSGQVVRPDQPGPANIPVGIKPAPPLQAEGAPSVYQGSWQPRPVSGNRNALIVLVNFSNRQLVTTAADWAGAVFSTTAGVKSVANYYADNSFKTLKINPTPHTQTGNPVGVITVNLPTAHPNTKGNITWTSDYAWIQPAVTAAAAFINFAAYDTSGDGILSPSELVIYLVAAGYESSGSAKSPGMWAHAWSSGSPTVSIGIKAGSKWLPGIALNGELNDANARHPMGVIAHELGHQLCGLPDLYDIAGYNGALGYYSLMAAGSWGANTGEYAGTTPTALDAWSRQFLGWSTPRLANETNSLISLGPALSANNTPVRLINTAKSTTEYFLVENRYPIGWDLGLRRITGFTGGLLITHINTANTPGSNDLNKYVSGKPQGVVPVQANTSNCNMLTSACRGSQATMFYAGNKNSFGPLTSPNSNYYTLGASGLSVTNISGLGQTMTANFNAPVSAPAYTISATAGPGGTITPAGSTTVTRGASKSFTITPNAGNKVLNVIVNGVSQGPVTTYTFTNITANHTINATFTTAVTPVITIMASAGVGGSISPAGKVTVVKGASPVFTIVPNAGYKIQNVTVNGVNKGAITSFTFSNVTAAHTISAAFASTTASPGQVTGTRCLVTRTSTTRATVALEIQYTGNLSGLSAWLTLPAGWSYISLTESAVTLGTPAPGATGTLQFTWATVPASPVKMAFQANVPPNASGALNVQGTIGSQTDNGPQTVALSSNPLILQPGSDNPSYLSSDNSPADWHISESELSQAVQSFTAGGHQSNGGAAGLSELLRLIQFYNLGGYYPDPTGEDGYAPGLTTSVTQTSPEALEEQPYDEVTEVSYGLQYDGADAVLNITIAPQAQPQALGMRLTLPQGWGFVSVTGMNAPNVAPTALASGGLEFAWTSPPQGPIDFTVTVRPVAPQGDQNATLQVFVRNSGPELAQNEGLIPLTSSTGEPTTSTYGNSAGGGSGGGCFISSLTDL